MFTIRKYLDFFLLLLASLLFQHLFHLQPLFSICSLAAFSASAASGHKIITSGSGSVPVEMSALSGGQARRRTWHFASVLTPTHEINEDFYQLAFHTDRQIINMERASINVVGYWIQRQVLNEARPTCVNFISWRFSRRDVATWFSNAEARTPLQNLPFEGYMQASYVVDISRLTDWMRHAHWNPLGMKLADCAEYKSFCASVDAYEVCSNGTPSLARAGRPPKKEKVTMQCLILGQIHLNFEPR